MVDFTAIVHYCIHTVCVLAPAHQGLEKGFRPLPEYAPNVYGIFRKSEEEDQHIYRVINGMWTVILAFGLLLTSLLVAKARSWRFGFGGLRGFLADYGAPLMVLAWSGLSFALRAMPPGVPRRVHTPNTWELGNNSDSFHVAGRMGEVPGAYIALAIIPAIFISVLFYFDHSISAKVGPPLHLTAISLLQSNSHRAAQMTCSNGIHLCKPHNHHPGLCYALLCLLPHRWPSSLSTTLRSPLPTTTTCCCSVA